MVRPGVQAGLFVAAGVDKVRLTGGEPTLRRDLPALVGRLAALPGLAAVGLTTNGLTLARQLPELRDAGAPRWPMRLWHWACSCASQFAKVFEIHVPPWAFLEIVWSDDRLQWCGSNCAVVRACESAWRRSVYGDPLFRDSGL